MKKCFFVFMSSIVITLFRTTTLTHAQDYFVYGEYAPGQDVYSINGYGDLLYVADENGYCYIYRVYRQLLSFKKNLDQKNGRYFPLGMR